MPNEPSKQQTQARGAAAVAGARSTPAATPAAKSPIPETRAAEAAPTQSAPVVVTMPAPPSFEQIRLECLKIALGQGLSTSTSDAKTALHRKVDDYVEIVAGPAPRAEAKTD